MAEKEYIEREAAIKVLCDACGNAACPKSLIPRCSYYEKMQSIPAADVRPVVKAHFKLVDGYSITALGYDIKGMECSNCGATYIAQAFVKKFNFCPNCGADMREES